MSRYPENWNEIAFNIKERAGWRCAKCNRQCLRPHEKPDDWSLSQRFAYTLQVHHWNRLPEDNRNDNLVAVCSGCHLSLHKGKLSNVSVGQLSLFEDIL